MLVWFIDLYLSEILIDAGCIVLKKGGRVMKVKKTVPFRQASGRISEHEML